MSGMPVPVPDGLREIRNVFGDIRQYVRPDGTLRSEWEHHELGMAALPESLPLGWDPEVSVSRIRCHVKLIPVFEDTYLEVHQRGLWPRLQTFDGCFNYRAKRSATKVISAHAWGIAVDHVPEGDMDPEVIEVFRRHGFKWGGEFGDPMHFQYCTGY